MTEQQMRDECSKIQAEWQMGGLTGGIYEDFAVELSRRAVMAEREKAAQWLKWYDGAETRRSEAIRNGDHWDAAIRQPAAPMEQDNV